MIGDYKMIQNMISSYESLATWSGIIYFFVIFVLLLIGNSIRRKVPLFRKSLLPTAVIAGLLGLIIKEAVIRPLTGFDFFFDESQITKFNLFLNTVTYHTLALGFITMGLKVNEKLSIKTNKAHSYYNGMVIVSTYLLQGIIGITITAILAFTFLPAFRTGPGLATGILLPFGYGQGPGQANNFGAVYETFTNAQGILTGFAGGQSYGLAMASMGFIWASIGGVIYLNKVYKKKVVGSEKESNLTSIQEVESPDEIPVSESIDKMTIQIAIVVVVYGFTLFTMLGLSRLAALNIGIYRLVNSLIWGFNFIFGIALAAIFSKIFAALRKKGIMTRQYPNNFMLNRIAGVVFDIMVVASITAINIEDLSKNNIWIAFIIISVVGGASTMIYLHFLTKRVYHKYQLEGFSTMYGMLTGTASSGIALLREVDPQFKTPAATDIVSGTATAILFGFPILLIASIAPNGIIHSLVSLGIIILLFFLFLFILLKKHPKSSV
jgi:glutamate:Na+ symporter, ESS family